MPPKPLSSLENLEEENIGVATSTSYSQSVLENLPSFRAFLSHAYKAPSVNRYFFKLFSEVARIRFEVDEGIDATCVTRLEKRMRESEAFVGVFSFRGLDDVGDAPLPVDPEKRHEVLLAKSRYFRLESALAARRKMPCLIFYDEDYDEIFDFPASFHVRRFDSREVLNSTTDIQAARFRRVIREFCGEVMAFCDHSVRQPEPDRNQVGIFLTRHYQDEERRLIKETLSEFGYVRIEEFEAPQQLDMRTLSRIDRLAWAVIDVGPENMTNGLAGYLHGLGLPLLRLARNTAETDVMALSSVQGLYGGQDAGFKKDIVCWTDLDRLHKEFEKRLLLLRHPKRTLFSGEEADAYFAQAAKRTESVFVSYCDEDSERARPLINALKSRFQEVFDYRDRELHLGGDWRFEMFARIASAHVGISLLSRNYIKSEYCLTEANHFAQYRIEEGMAVIPLFVSNERISIPKNLPSFAGLQYMRVSEFKDTKAVVRKIEDSIDEQIKRKLIPFQPE